MYTLRRQKTRHFNILSYQILQLNRDEEEEEKITRDILAVVRSSVVNLTVLSYFLFKIRLTWRVLIIHIRIS